jgi:hypothetical protein
LNKSIDKCVFKAYNIGTKKEREVNKMATIITTTLFWQFVILNFVNVLINTARSLTTVKGGKWIASLMNALCYGYYTVIIVITATYEIPLTLKIIAVAIVNFIGVFTIKFCEEKLQKEKMWIYNATAKVCNNDLLKVVTLLKNADIKLVYTCLVENELYTLTIFANNSKESEMVKSILENYNIKYYAVETKEINGN